MSRPTSLALLADATESASVFQPAPKRAGPVGAKLVLAAALEPRTLATTSGAVATALPLAFLGLPLVAAAAAGLGLFAACVLVARGLRSPELAVRVYGPLGQPFRPEVEPEELPPEVATAYAELLATHEHIRVCLGECHGLVEPLRIAYARLSDLARLAGRVGKSSLRLRQYLDRESPGRLLAEQQRLETRASVTDDAVAAAVFRRAALARRQQIATYRELEGLYERVVARLYAVASTFAMVEALIIKLGALDHEQVESVGRALTEHVEQAGGDLEVLGVSLEAALC